MIHALKLLLVGLVCGTMWSPPTHSYGTGWADAPCRYSGRVLAEDFYTRTYIRDCTWVWDARGGRMQIAGGAGEDGLATNAWIHYKPAGTCTDAEWWAQIKANGRPSHALCQHRGGHAT